MRKFFGILFFLLISTLGFSQSVQPYLLSNAGGKITCTNGNNDTIRGYYSLGETCIQTIQVESYKKATQGFHQPDYDGKGPVEVAINKKDIYCLRNQDGEICLQISGGYGKSSFEWQHDKENDSLCLHNLAPGTYKVIVLDTLPNGGIFKSNDGNAYEVVITALNNECMLKLYNSFSPNGDGKNELFYIEGIQHYPDNKVFIFNRWGVRVWYGEKYDNVNKKFIGIDEHGNELPEGTYYYVIDVPDSPNLKGWVEIVR